MAAEPGDTRTRARQARRCSSIPPRTSYLSLPVEPIEDATSWLNRETETILRNMPSAPTPAAPCVERDSRGIDKRQNHHLVVRIEPVAGRVGGFVAVRPGACDAGPEGRSRTRDGARDPPDEARWRPHRSWRAGHGRTGSTWRPLTPCAAPQGVTHAGAPSCREARNAGAERFQRLREPLGVGSFGINLIRLQPGQRGRIHRHERQEEGLPGPGGRALPDRRGGATSSVRELVRVAPHLRRRQVNRGPGRCVILALGGAGEHVGRDGTAFVSWEATEGGPPQEMPLPEDLPPGERRA